MTIIKPRKVTVPLATGLAWRGGGGFRFEEKMDGVFSTRQIGGCLVAGELMKSGEFIAFDCLAVNEQDIRTAPLRERLAVLDGLSISRPATGTGGEFLEAILARGGEGVCRKDLSAPYGEMIVCKRLVELLCVVTQIGTSQAVKIADATTGADRGKVCLFGGKVDRVRVGSVIKVVGMELTDNGKVREPRLCQDTPTSWLVKW